jgi:hypothetical protein
MFYKLMMELISANSCLHFFFLSNYLSYHKNLMCVFYYCRTHLSFKVVGIIDEVEPVFFVSPVLLNVLVLSTSFIPN